MGTEYVNVPTIKEMIPTILSKVLEELNSATPRLDYIKGMVEVLLASEEKPKVILDPLQSIGSQQLTYPVTTPVTFNVSSSTDPEAQIMDAKTTALLATVKKGMSVE